MLRIETPLDPDCGANTDSRFFKDNSIPELIIDDRIMRRKRKGRFFMTQSQRENKKEENYFQKMFKETKKKIYVSMFIRKLKQSIPSRNNFEHALCEEENDKYYGAVKTVKWNINF